MELKYTARPIEPHLSRDIRRVMDALPSRGMMTPTRRVEWSEQLAHQLHSYFCARLTLPSEVGPIVKKAAEVLHCKIVNGIWYPVSGTPVSLQGRSFSDLVDMAVEELKAIEKEREAEARRKQRPAMLICDDRVDCCCRPWKSFISHQRRLEEIVVVDRLCEALMSYRSDLNSPFRLIHEPVPLPDSIRESARHLLSEEDKRALKEGREAMKKLAAIGGCISRGEDLSRAPMTTLNCIEALIK